MRNVGYFDARSRFGAGIEELGTKWGWYFALGTVLIVLGAVAASFAYMTTVASVIVFGWLLLFAGVTLGVLSFMTGRWSGFLLALAAGVLSVITGIMLIRAPLAGAASLTLVIAVFLLVTGIFRAVSSVVMRFPTWGWSLVSGLIALALGAILLAGWPQISVWFLGFYVGIDLIAHGFAWCMFALGVRGFARELGGRTERRAA
jgi:uncharacterized membrane protein HdeD (DUF308 family)